MGLKRTCLARHPLLAGENMWWVWDDYQYPTHINVSPVFKVTILFLVKWPSWICWLSSLEWLPTIEHKIQSFYKHAIPFCCPYLDPHLTRHHSNIGVHLRSISKMWWIKYKDVCQKKLTHVFFVSVLRSTLNHVSLKHNFPVKKNDRIRSAYLIIVFRLLLWSI